MCIKNVVRRISQNNNLIEKLWIILWWKKTRYLAHKYSDVEYSKKIYKRARKKKLDLDNVKTYNEKMWFLKLSNRDPLLTKCSDKHLAREYVKECGLEDILKEEYAVFDNADQIDFEKLPSPCYIKCNHASGMNMVFDGTKKYDLDHIKWKFNYLLSQQPYYLSREWNYKNIEPKIICEEVLSMPDGVSDIPEVQFFCFNGEIMFMIYNLGLADKSGNHTDPRRWALWADYTLIEEAKLMNLNNTPPQKPKNFAKMEEIAKKLSAPFKHVRVDLFNIEGRIIFNELTFYSGGGFTLSGVKELQEKCGDAIDISDLKIAGDARAKKTWEDVESGM